MEFNSNTVTLRDFRREDINALCDYWYRSPPGFLESMGVIPAKLNPESERRKHLIAMLANPVSDKELQRCDIVIEIDGKGIGTHGLGAIKFGDSGVFHAHIWDPSFRRIGLGSYTYPRACKYFFERFQLKKILFHTPIKNAGPNKVKQKLGLKPTGEIVLDYVFIEPGLKAWRYELYPEQLSKMLNEGK